MADHKINNIRTSQKRDIKENWIQENPVLLDGEIGIEKDTNKMKIGDGVTKYSDLEYLKTDADENLPVKSISKDFAFDSNTGELSYALKWRSYLNHPYTYDFIPMSNHEAQNASLTNPQQGQFIITNSHGNLYYYVTSNGTTSRIKLGGQHTYCAIVPKGEYQVILKYADEETYKISSTDLPIITTGDIVWLSFSGTRTVPSDKNRIQMLLRNGARNIELMYQNQPFFDALEADNTLELKYNENIYYPFIFQGANYHKSSGGTSCIGKLNCLVDLQKTTSIFSPPKEGLGYNDTILNLKPGFYYFPDGNVHFSDDYNKAMSAYLIITEQASTFQQGKSNLGKIFKVLSKTVGQPVSIISYEGISNYENTYIDWSKKEESSGSDLLVEQGTWTPDISTWTSNTATNITGTYTLIGNRVNATILFEYGGSIGNTVKQIGGLPIVPLNWTYDSTENLLAKGISCVITSDDTVVSNVYQLQYRYNTNTLQFMKNGTPSLSSTDIGEIFQGYYTLVEFSYEV